MNQSAKDVFKNGLRRYVPADAVDPIFDFMDHYHVHMRVTPQRQSKLGDYRWPQPPRHNYHEISVNGNLNPYFFLWVLLHEMAHLSTHVRYGSRVQPHGHEWQDEYRHQLLRYQDCFPGDAKSLLPLYCNQIPLSRSVGSQIEELLHHYDKDYSPAQSLTLNQLSPGTRFRLKDKQQYLFEVIEKRRTRWLCLEVPSGQKCLVQGTALVLVEQ